MFFIIGSFIIALSASLITIRVFCAYSTYSPILKYLFSLIVILGWFSPVLNGLIRHLHLLRGEAYGIAQTTLYTLFGFAFILFCLIMVRDFGWFLLHRLTMLFGKPSSFLNPMNGHLLNICNAATFMVAVALSGYALYEGIKTPEIREIRLYSPKIEQPATIAYVSDIHANQATSLKRLKRLQAQLTGIRPDVVLLGGDIVDDRPLNMIPQISALKNFPSRYGTYMVLGNHEFYAGLQDWLKLFPQMGYQVLYNNAFDIPELNLRISGVPDYESTKYAPLFLRANIAEIQKTEKKTDKERYKIMLSHSPRFIETLPKAYVDLVLSGHTHGGQIYPFHHLVKWFNHGLSGLETIKGITRYISNGYGTWGPSMRLLAPSELTVIYLLPKKES